LEVRESVVPMSDLLVSPEAAAQKKWKFLINKFTPSLVESICNARSLYGRMIFLETRGTTDRKKTAIGIDLRCQVMIYLATSHLDSMKAGSPGVHVAAVTQTTR